jgi:hypothetical protein
VCIAHSQNAAAADAIHRRDERKWAGQPTFFFFPDGPARVALRGEVGAEQAEELISPSRSPALVCLRLPLLAQRCADGLAPFVARVVVLESVCRLVIAWPLVRSAASTPSASTTAVAPFAA